LETATNNINGLLSQIVTENISFSQKLLKVGVEQNLQLRERENVEVASDILGIHLDMIG
jgi:hypothetical protein